MDPVGDLAGLASPDPRARFAAEARLAASGEPGIRALAHLLSCDGVPDGLRARAADLLGTLIREGAVATFRGAVPDPADPDLWAGAVAIAAEGHPGLDATEANRRLDDLVEGARRVVPDEAPVADRVERLTAYLARDEGFHGDEGSYHDLKNSYLPDVLDRRIGIPVTLSVLWISIARRLGLRVSGVGLPLHFVARCEAEEDPLFVDAFHGDVLDRDGCRRLVAKAAGRDVLLPDRAFRPLRNGEVLGRMLRNLRAAHENAGNLHAALAAVDRSLWLTPLDPAGWRERAVLLARLSRPAAAARSLSRALALDPTAADRATIEALRKRLQGEAAARN
jgi:regulator of sirC expression with transglutaminase-like and TPR domain